MSYYVICREDQNEEGHPGKYLLMNKTFTSWNQAQGYAATISNSREPKVLADRDGVVEVLESYSDALPDEE